MLPPSPMDWLSEGHLAYFVLEVVRELDVGAIEAVIQKKDPRGERPYSPRMMTSLSYLSEKNIVYCETSGTNACIALKKKGAESREMPKTGPQHARFAMQVKLRTAEGRAAYARRKVIVEPVFGQIKAAIGFRRFYFAAQSSPKRQASGASSARATTS